MTQTGTLDSLDCLVVSFLHAWWALSKSTVIIKMDTCSLLGIYIYKKVLIVWINILKSQC